MKPGRIVASLVKASEQRNLRLKTVFAIVLVLLAAFMFIKPTKMVGFAEWLLSPDNAAKIRLLIATDKTTKIPITIIDIDNATFEAWGQPISTPRNRLLALIEETATRQPAAIIVDIDVTATENSSDQRAFRMGLKSIEENPNTPPIILMRRLWYLPADASRGVNESVALPTYGGGAQIELENELKELEKLVELSPKLAWASPLHFLDDDGILRSWRLGEVVCNPAAGPVRGFFAPSLIAGLIWQQKNAKKDHGIVGIKNLALKYAERRCTQGSKEKINASLQAVSKNLISLHDEKIRIPFIYTFHGGNKFFVGGSESVDLSGRIVPTAIQISAKNLQQANPTLGIALPSSENICALEEVGKLPDGYRSCNGIKDRIVLIGATHLDARDRHVTPIGLQSGVEILANTISGMPYTLQNAKSSMLVRYIPMAVLFAIFAAASHFLVGFMALAILFLTVVLFVFFSGLIGFDASLSYETVSGAFVMLGIFLTATSFFIWLGKFDHFKGLVVDKKNQKRRRNGVSAILMANCLVFASQDEPKAQTTTQTKPAVGTFDRLEPRGILQSNVLLSRDGVPERSLRLGEYVYEGDVIRVPKANAAVTITGINRAQTFCLANDSIEQCRLVVSREGGILERTVRFSENLARIANWYGPQNTATLATRSGQNPVIDIAGPRPQQIATGERSLFVAWLNGEKPFNVRLEKDGSIINQLDTKEQFAQLGSAQLGPGRYAIIVTDARDRKTKLELAAVVNVSKPPDFIGAYTSNDHHIYLTAGWLAAQQNGAYNFEAMQQLSSIAARYQPATGLLRGLARKELVRPE